MAKGESKKTSGQAGRRAHEMGRALSVGVGLREREIEELDELGESLGFTRNALMAWFIRRGLREVREGRLEIPVEVETTTRLGDP